MAGKTGTKCGLGSWIAFLSLFLINSSAFASTAIDPSAPDYKGRKGTTIYVSKTGNNSDGSNWLKAYQTIQAALSAIPDTQGGHMILVRPDTYNEANLSTAYKGAQGSYNLLIGDSDGRLGSGATGRIIIDAGDPQRGFKSSDWWGTICTPSKAWRNESSGETFSSICWDRWILRNLYATGGDVGLFWDIGEKSKEGFTVIVEDCVGIGRAFGGGFGCHTVREKEPIIFSRCHLMCMDWTSKGMFRINGTTGNSAGAIGVGANHSSLPSFPDAIFEDCTFVSADNAVYILQPTQYSRVKFKNCRMIVLNFSPPHGECSSGVICSDSPDLKEGYFHADLEDCTLMGCRLFGTGNAGKERITFTTQGTVSAYVHYRQTVPAGFKRLGLMPVDVLARIAPPGNDRESPGADGKLKRSILPPIPGDPSGNGYAGRKGMTLYVSRQGDNSDGSSWQKAFHTIQAALLAVPDSLGGHRIVIRPDTYTEANLYPSHKGAKGAYNILLGDCDGSLGSGAEGWVVIDGGCPGVAVRATNPWGTGIGYEIVESKEPESGLKACDWWCVFLSDNQNSGIVWDRWIYRNLYVTGTEGGIGWDIGNAKSGSEFSAVVEDCVGVGRFAGAFVAAHTPRKDEPVLFRSSYFMNLDRWVDDGAAYIRGESRDSMPAGPHAVFEDCTIIGPAAALRMNQVTGDFYHWVKFRDSRLIVLNFSKSRLFHRYPVAILRCDVASDKLRLDFEDCALMGYMLGNPGTYTTRGKVQVYVQFEQYVPEGFERLGLWPVKTFDKISPPKIPAELND